MSLPLILSSSAADDCYKSFSSYSELRNQIKAQSQNEHFKNNVIIFGLTWIVVHDSVYLAACTSTGELAIWNTTSNSDDDDETDCTLPISRFSVNQGKLYSIKLERVQDKSLLIVSGDEGVSVFDWDKDIWKAHLQSASPKTSTKTMSLNPLSTFQPHPSPLEAKGIEVNEIELVQQGSKSYLFGAAGDSFGAYKWDLSTERLVANYATTCGGYLHAIRLLPSDDGSDAKQTLLTGGEGGKLSFWDVSADKLIDKVDLTTVTSASTLSTLSSSKSNSSLHRSNSMNKRSKSAPARWISSICAQDQNWLTVGGGTGGGPGSRGSGNAGGFLATFHGPTRSLISFAETRETPQQLAIFPSSSSDADFEHHTLVSVANEGVVSHFNSLTLERTRRLWCTPPSAYATSVSEDGKYTAVAGVGCLVDVFNASGEKSMRLSIY